VTCADGKTACYGSCFDLKTDAKHCGGCDNACASGECNAGVCKVVKACFKKTTIVDSTLADFETYDGTTDPFKWGWAFNAPSGKDNAVYAGLYKLDDGTGSPKMTIAGPGYDSSKYAATSSNESMKGWGGGIGMWMACIDASAYKGISFWVKGTTPKGTGTLTLAMEATSPPDEKDAAGGGTCTLAKKDDCKGPSVDFDVTSSWTRVIATWDQFAAGAGTAGAVTADGKSIIGLSWGAIAKYEPSASDPKTYVPVAGSYNLSLDKVEFIADTSKSCEGSQKLCGVACTDTSKDMENCGTCANACTGARTCTDSKCVCPTGYSECGTECVDPKVDAQNCGGCGKQCTGVCSDGTCKASECTANMPKKDTKTAKGDSITLGKYWLNNNWWGSDNATGSQSVWSTCSSGNTIGWGTEWNWSGGNGVISYVSAVLGWHYGWKITNTGLPVQISAGKKISCGWTYKVTPGKIINVSYDLFAHTQANPTGDEKPSDEIMIWLYRAGGAAPIGTSKATVTIGGNSYELFQGTTTWNVHSYVRTTNADTGATLNISDFIKDLTDNRGFAKSKYLTSIQAGTEVFQGSGSLNTDQYTCTIE
jgi:hypothetical protein